MVDFIPHQQKIQNHLQKLAGLAAVLKTRSFGEGFQGCFVTGE